MALGLKRWVDDNLDQLSRLENQLQALAAQAFVHVNGAAAGSSAPHYRAIPESIRDAVRSALVAGSFPELPGGAIGGNVAPGLPGSDTAPSSLGEHATESSKETEDKPLAKRRKLLQGQHADRMPFAPSARKDGGLAHLSLDGLMQLASGVVSEQPRKLGGISAGLLSRPAGVGLAARAGDASGKQRRLPGLHDGPIGRVGSTSSSGDARHSPPGVGRSLSGGGGPAGIGGGISSLLKSNQSLPHPRPQQEERAAAPLADSQPLPAAPRGTVPQQGMQPQQPGHERDCKPHVPAGDAAGAAHTSGRAAGQVTCGPAGATDAAIAVASAEKAAAADGPGAGVCPAADIGTAPQQPQQQVEQPQLDGEVAPKKARRAPLWLQQMLPARSRPGSAPAAGSKRPAAATGAKKRAAAAAAAGGAAGGVAGLEAGGLPRRQPGAAAAVPLQPVTGGSAVCSGAPPPASTCAQAAAGAGAGAGAAANNHVDSSGAAAGAAAAPADGGAPVPQRDSPQAFGGVAMGGPSDGGASGHSSPCSSGGTGSSGGDDGQRRTSTGSGTLTKTQLRRKRQQPQQLPTPQPQPEQAQAQPQPQPAPQPQPLREASQAEHVAAADATGPAPAVLAGVSAAAALAVTPASSDDGLVDLPLAMRMAKRQKGASAFAAADASSMPAGEAAGSRDADTTAGRTLNGLSAPSGMTATEPVVAAEPESAPQAVPLATSDDPEAATTAAAAPAQALPVAASCEGGPEQALPSAGPSAAMHAPGLLEAETTAAAAAQEGPAPQGATAMDAVHQPASGTDVATNNPAAVGDAATEAGDPDASANATAAATDATADVEAALDAAAGWDLPREDEPHHQQQPTPAVKLERKFKPSAPLRNRHRLAQPQLQPQAQAGSAPVVTPAPSADAREARGAVIDTAAGANAASEALVQRHANGPAATMPAAAAVAAAANAAPRGSAGAGAGADATAGGSMEGLRSFSSGDAAAADASGVARQFASAALPPKAATVPTPAPQQQPQQLHHHHHASQARTTSSARATAAAAAAAHEHEVAALRTHAQLAAAAEYLAAHLGEDGAAAAAAEAAAAAADQTEAAAAARSRATRPSSSGSGGLAGAAAPRSTARVRSTGSGGGARPDTVPRPAASGGVTGPAAHATASRRPSGGALGTVNVAMPVAAAAGPGLSAGPAGGSDCADFAPGCGLQRAPVDTATSPVRAPGGAHDKPGMTGPADPATGPPACDGSRGGSPPPDVGAAGSRGGGASEGGGSGDGDEGMSAVEREEWRRRRAEIERQRAEAAAEREAARRARAAAAAASTGTGAGGSTTAGNPAAAAAVAAAAAAAVDAELQRRIRERLAEHHQAAEAAAAEAEAKEQLRIRVRLQLQDRHRKALQERNLGKLLRGLGTLPKNAPPLRTVEQRTRALKAAKIRFHPDKAAATLEARVYAEEVSKLLNSCEWNGL